MFFKLRKLFEDYEKWQGGTLSYQQFYSIYGKSTQNFVHLFNCNTPTKPVRIQYFSPQSQSLKTLPCIFAFRLYLRHQLEDTHSVNHFYFALVFNLICLIVESSSYSITLCACMEFFVCILF